MNAADDDRNPDAVLLALAEWCLGIATGRIEPPHDITDQDDHHPTDQGDDARTDG